VDLKARISPVFSINRSRRPSTMSARFFPRTLHDRHAVIAATPQLNIRRVNLDTGRENVVVISRQSTALRPDVFRGFSRVELRANSKVLLATLLLTDDGMVAPERLSGGGAGVTVIGLPTCSPKRRKAGSASPSSSPPPYVCTRSEDGA
jgi:hypothetical protein